LIACRCNYASLVLKIVCQDSYSPLTSDRQNDRCAHRLSVTSTEAKNYQPGNVIEIHFREEHTMSETSSNETSSTLQLCQV